MGRPFRRRQRGGTATVEVALDPRDRELLVSLLGQVADLLADGQEPESDDPLARLVGIDLSPGPTTPPDDPALARLLPDGSREDAEASEEFRRLTERGLRRRKRDAIRAAVEALLAAGPGASRPVELGLDQAEALLRGLTDLRLVLAERLGLRTDEDASRLHRLVARGDEDDPWVRLAVIYDVLTWWQEALVEAVAG